MKAFVLIPLASAGSFDAGVALGNAINRLSEGERLEVAQALGGGGSSFLQEKLPPLNLHIGETAPTSFLQDKSLVEQVQFYSSRLAAGGDDARAAVSSLLSLCAVPNARAVMTASPLVFRLGQLLKRESTPDIVREMAGSLITFITDRPVATTVTDDEGSSGHVNIVLPSPGRIYGGSFLKSRIFDMPSEIFQDVNKNVAPLVNVIADAADGAEMAEIHRSQRRAAAFGSFLKTSTLEGLVAQLQAMHPNESTESLESFATAGLAAAAAAEGA